MTQNKKWKVLKPDEDSVSYLQHELDTSKLTASLLVNRGIKDIQEAKDFLYGTIDDISNPFAILNMGKVVEELLYAIHSSQKICIFGDYDVDGMLSTILLSKAIQQIGGDVFHYIPSRKEGYGLNRAALEEIFQKADLLITVDTGIASADLINEFASRGLHIIVTDHHQLPKRLPRVTILNPHLEPDQCVPWRSLCGCGLSLMLTMALFEKEDPYLLSHEKISPYFQLAAIATIADLVSLKYDNRLIAKTGIKFMRKQPLSAISALASTARIDISHITSEDIAFYIAPKINSCGRLGVVEKVFELFNASNQLEIEEKAREIDELNNERKDMVEIGFQESLEQTKDLADDAPIIVKGAWEPGVIGIIASRLTERFNKPSIVFSTNEDPYVGSGRSIGEFNLFDALQQTQSFLAKFGGHKMACGLSIDPVYFDEFKKQFNDIYREYYSSTKDEAVLLLDGALKLSDINDGLLWDIEKFEPSGYDMPTPQFLLYQTKEYETNLVGDTKAHLRAVFSNQDQKVHGIGFFLDQKYLKIGHRKLDFAVTLKRDNWQGKDRIQAVIADIHPATQDLNHYDYMYDLGTEWLIHDSYLDIEEERAFYTKVVGTTFEDRQELIANLQPGDQLLLVREPENNYDSNAIAVFCAENRIGYLKKELAKHLAPLMDLDKKIYQIKSWEKTGQDKAFYGINLYIIKNGKERSIDLNNLKRHLDFNDLYPSQKEALEFLATNRSTLAVLPTGRGKTLISYFHMLQKSKKGELTILFCPLRSLINDQHRRFLEWTQYSEFQIMKALGGMTQEERQELEIALHNGTCDMIITTPEFYLANITLFQSGKRRTGFIIFDEAHHLGRRPGYKRIIPVIKSLNSQILGLTATASHDTVKYLQEMSSEPLDIVYDDSERDNLSIIDQRSLKRKIAYLYPMAMGNERTVVYVNSRKGCFELARRLREALPPTHRSQVGYYHGGMPKKAREEVEAKYYKGHYRFLVATSAFGEGIDIGDIHHVVFFHMPFSFEMFNQLAGRAGRDGKKAYIHLIFGHNDIGLNLKVLEHDTITRSYLGEIYKSLTAVSQNNTIVNYQIWIKELLDTGKIKVHIDKSLNILEQLELISIEEVDSGKQIFVQQNPTKKDLFASPIWLEDILEIEAFEKFSQWVMKSEVEKLEETIRHAMFLKEEGE